MRPGGNVDNGLDMVGQESEALFALVPLVSIKDHPMMTPMVKFESTNA